MTIHKYQLVIDDYQAVEMPANATLLRFGIQGETLMLWALVNPEAPMVQRRLRLCGTGHPIDIMETVRMDGSERYCGTVDDGPLVWHLFDLGEA